VPNKSTCSSGSARLPRHGSLVCGRQLLWQLRLRWSPSRRLSSPVFVVVPLDRPLRRRPLAWSFRRAADGPPRRPFIWHPARWPPVLLSAVRVRIFAPFFLCDVGRRHQPACAPQPLAAALWSRVNAETEPVGTGRQAAPCPAVRGVSGLRSKWAGTRTTAPASQNLHPAPHCSQLSNGLPDAARRARTAQAAAVHPVRPARLSRSVCRAAMATTEVCPAPRCLAL